MLFSPGDAIWKDELEQLALGDDICGNEDGYRVDVILGHAQVVKVGL